MEIAHGVAQYGLVRICEVKGDWLVEKYKLFWGDAHSNIHTESMQDLEKWFEQAMELIDFWPIAYYPYHMKKVNGFGLEDWLDDGILKEDWKNLKRFVMQKNQEHNGEFVAFMGFEWQGDGQDGDHNIFYLDDDQVIHKTMHFKDLISVLPKGRAIAIPHHTAYKLGSRGKNWAIHDEVISPFAEIYSSHGSSECDLTDIPMNRHIHMGPRVDGGTVLDGLSRGNKFGIIASTDNHDCPAVYGQGLMACYAENLSKEAIWDAFINRRVYGVTGDRIKLLYKINDSIMGSKVKANPPYLHNVEVEGGSAIHRVELYRNNILTADYTHTGKWELLPLSEVVKFKFKVEFGWGPDLKIYPDMKKKVWQGSLETEGEIHSVEKCWTNYGQKLNNLNKNRCEFEITSYKTVQSSKWMGISPVQTQAFIFEIEAPLHSSIKLVIDNRKILIPVADILQKSHLFGFLNEAKELVEERWGIKSYYRNDPFWHAAYKVKIHRGIPEIGYKVNFNWVSEEKVKDEDFFWVKVIQRDGNTAWSSPIWIQ